MQGVESHKALLGTEVMKWVYFGVIIYAPALVWSVLLLPVLFKWSGIHRFWGRTLISGLLLTLIPYPLTYFICRKSGLNCPANIGQVADFIVMTGTVFMGLVLAGVWNKGFDRMLRKAYARENKSAG